MSENQDQDQNLTITSNPPIISNQNLKSNPISNQNLKSNPILNIRWKKEDNYFELQSEQRSPEWHAARKCMITGSVLQSVIGWNKYSKREDVLRDILGLSPPIEVNVNMQRGIDGEEPLRNTFMEECLPGWSYSEPSLCFGVTVYDFPFSNGELLSQRYGKMKDNPFHPQWFIGASPDGLAELNGQPDNKVVLECKCPEYLYAPLQVGYEEETWGAHSYPHLLTDEERKESGDAGQPIDYYSISNKIKVAHLLQMYGQMAATQRPHAYYVVGFEKPSCGYYFEKIDFDRDTWQRKIYPGIVYFIINLLIPSMSETQKQEHVAKVNSLLEGLNEKLVEWME